MPEGTCYGTTYWGGLFGQGTIFEITPAGQLTTMHSFAGGPTEGAFPIAGLVQLEATSMERRNWAAPMGGHDLRNDARGPADLLYSFCSQPGCADGELPYGGLIQATNGNLYGTTLAGGTSGTGTVFEITPAGQLTTLYKFCSQPGCTDGAAPFAGLVQANGNFYGTTEAVGPTDREPSMKLRQRVGLPHFTTSAPYRVARTVFAHTLGCCWPVTETSTERPR